MLCYFLLIMEHTVTLFKDLKVSITMFQLFSTGSLWKLFTQRILADDKEVVVLMNVKGLLHSPVAITQPHSVVPQDTPSITTSLYHLQSSASHLGRKVTNIYWFYCQHALSHFIFLKGNYETPQEYFY